MSIDNTIYALSNINAILGSATGLLNDQRNGVPIGNAVSNMGYNLMNGVFRNEMSREIQQSTGSYLGYAINSAAGYGSPQANYQGTVGTINAAMLTSPFGIFDCNPFMTSAIYGCGPFGGSFMGGGFPYGCNRFGLGMPSFFSPMGFYC